MKNEFYGMIDVTFVTNHIPNSSIIKIRCHENAMPLRIKYKVKGPYMKINDHTS